MTEPMPMMSRADVAPLSREQTSNAMLPAPERAAYRMGHLAGRKLMQLGQPSVNRLDGKGRPTMAASWRRGYADGQEACRP